MIRDWFFLHSWDQKLEHLRQKFPKKSSTSFSLINFNVDSLADGFREARKEIVNIFRSNEILFNLRRKRDEKLLLTGSARRWTAREKDFNKQENPSIRFISIRIEGN